MKPLELLRQKIYWELDALRGHPVKKHLDDIKSVFSTWGTPENTLKLQKTLSGMLDYVVNNVAFYKNYQGYTSLTDFPVVNKGMIKNHEKDFLSGEYEKSKLFKQETSGSTGMPFAVYQDPVKRLRATADTLFFSEKAGYELGTRLYFSRVWEDASKRSKWTCFKQNWVVHDASSLSDEAIGNLLDMWERDDSTKSVLIFASSLTAIAKYLIREKFQPKAKIESFITLSESLDLWTKKIIEQVYHTHVYSRYSNQELGIMAQQLPGSNDFLLNVGSFYFELLDLNEDRAVEPGKPGRIVVTDLYNKSMPLIRYDTGDVAVAKKTVNAKRQLPILETVEGRRVDFIFDTHSNMVSPYVINTPMHEFLEIQQYQFIQESEKGYTMLLNLKNDVSFSRESELLKVLKSYLGDDAVINVKYVSEIPVLKSGKRKQVVNKYRPL